MNVILDIPEDLRQQANYILNNGSVGAAENFLELAEATFTQYNMIEAEPAIQQLLKIDFEEKVRDTVMRSFRQVINKSIH
jgi:hypothetical protein